MNDIPTQRTPAEFLAETIDALDAGRASTPSHSLDVERFSLYDGDTSMHFESDPDLYLGCSRALGNAPGKPRASQAALVLVELGVDGCPTHVVRVDRTGNYPGPGDDPARYQDSFNYPGGQSGNALMMRDAITALQAVLDQLLTMQSVTEAHRGVQA
jgi:hypothetical protein